MNEWTDKQTNKQTNKRVNKRTKKWINEWMNEWTNEQMNEWMNERMNEWTKNLPKGLGIQQILLLHQQCMQIHFFLHTVYQWRNQHIGRKPHLVYSKKKETKKLLEMNWNIWFTSIKINNLFNKNSSQTN